MPSGADWWRPRFLAPSLALVLFMRGLYLVRFGWDPGWMNVTYLLRAKQWAMGATFIGEEPPLTPLLLWAGRMLGLSAAGSLGAVYLLCHVVLFLGILGLGWFLWPAASARRRICVTLTAALVPLVACETGRNNLGVLVGASLATAALALAAAATRVPGFARLLLAALAAFLAGSARLESLLTCVSGAALLLFWRRRASAAVLGGASVLAYLVSAHFRGSGPSDYAFYTFYDGLPFLLHPKLTLSEYDRYRASVSWFGSFEENHKSLWHALAAHPLAALWRFSAKSLDMLGVLIWPQSLTPIGFAALISGMRRRAHDWDDAWLLAAFLPALAVLFIPFCNPHYYLSIAAPLVLLASRGFDRWTAALEPRAARNLAILAAVTFAALVAWVGRFEPASSRTLNQAAAWLEQRCKDGCLANVVPQALERQTWVELQAGAKIVRGHSRGEASITGDYARSHEQDYNFCQRVKRARDSGFRGPVLYIDTRISSYRAFDPDFDPEVRYQGTVNLAGAVEERRFASGGDQLIIYRMPDNLPCDP